MSKRIKVSTNQAVPKITPLQLHIDKWTNCQLCNLCERRRKVVIGRGSLPCKILFIAEAPGASEDMMGVPLIGPAGHLLDKMIREAIPETISYAMTNLVGCIPKDEDGDKVGAPGHDEIKTCSPRLLEFVQLANPRLIIAVGTLARDYLTPGMLGNIKIKPFKPVVDIIHPAAILREKLEIRRWSEYRKAVQRLEEAVTEYV